MDGCVCLPCLYNPKHSLRFDLGVFNVPLTEEIPSDEDEVSENHSAMQQPPLPNTPGQSGEDDEEEDDYWDDDGFEGTPLEEYSTPLDFENGEDEFHFFTSTLLRMSPPSFPPSAGCLSTLVHLHRQLLLICQGSRPLMLPGTTL